MELLLAVEAGNITVVMMAVEYKSWMPAGIIDAMWNQ